jgi:hypothetical protein
MPGTGTRFLSRQPVAQSLYRRYVCEAGISVFRRVHETAKKSDYNFYMHVFPHGKTRFPLDGFSWNFILDFVEKIEA